MGISKTGEKKALGIQALAVIGAILAALSGVLIALPGTSYDAVIAVLVLVTLAPLALVLRTRLLLLILPITLPFYDLEVPVIATHVSPADMVMWLIILSYFATIRFNETRIHLSGAEKTLIVLVLVRGSLVLIAPDKRQGLIAASSFFIAVAFAIVCKQIFLRAPSKFFSDFTKVFLIASIPAAILGIAQFLVRRPIIDLTAFPAYRYDALVYARRVQGFFANPNTFASYMVIVVLIALGFYYRKRKTVFGWVSTVGILVVGAINVILTLSRGAFLGLVGGLAVFSGKQRIVRSARSIILALFAFLALYAIYNRLTIESSRRNLIEAALSGDEIRDQSALNRIYFVTTSIEMMKKNYLMGVGTGQYGFLFNDFRDPRIVTEREIFPSHSTFLTFMGENGLPGILLFIVAIYAVSRRALAVPNPEDANPGSLAEYRIFTGFRAAWFSYLVFGFTHNTVNGPLLYLLTAIVLAMSERLLVPVDTADHWPTRPLP